MVGVKVEEGKLLSIDELHRDLRKKIYAKVPFQFLDKMVEEARYAKTDRARTFAVCYDKERREFSVTPPTEGEDPRKACKGEALGTYRVYYIPVQKDDYPNAIVTPSIHDIDDALQHNDRFMCVAAKSLVDTTERDRTRINYNKLAIKCASIDVGNPDLEPYKKKFAELRKKLDELHSKAEIEKVEREGKGFLREMEEKRLINYFPGLRLEDNAVVIDILENFWAKRYRG